MATSMVPGTTAQGPAQGDAPFRMGTVIVPLIAIIIGIFMVVLDGTAVNVALPKLVDDLHTTLPTLQWIVTGYTLAQAAVIPVLANSRIRTANHLFRCTDARISQHNGRQ